MLMGILSSIKSVKPIFLWLLELLYLELNQLRFNFIFSRFPPKFLSLLSEGN